MGTTPALCHQIRHYTSHQSVSSTSSPPLATLHHHSRRRFHHHHHHDDEEAKFAMPLRDLTLLRTATTTLYLFRFNHPQKAFCSPSHFTSINHKTMAEEESKSKDVEPGNVDPTTLNFSNSKDEREKAPEKSIPAIPPPPEKPLPGDCCGSGCVRCVWDVYYEELDEYNRLYKADSKTS